MLLADGFRDLLGGMSSGLAPEQLQANQAALLVNATVRGAKVTNRPVFRPVKVNNQTVTVGGSDLVQGLDSYSPPNGDMPYLFAMVGGRIYRIDLDGTVTDETATNLALVETSATVLTTASFVVPAIAANVQVHVPTESMSLDYPVVHINNKRFTLISIDSGALATVKNYNAVPGTIVPGNTIASGVEFTFSYLGPDLNSPTAPMVWMKQGEQYFFIQDGQARPLIYDGATWRRAKKFEPPDWEMPVGTAMEYAFGRMLVAQNRKWFAGDIRGGPTQIYNFTENSFLAEGGSWTVPIPGLITAMKVMTALDNGIGQGPMTIHTPNGIVTARIDQPRAQWKDIQFQQIANQLNGGLSQNSCVVVNGDLWFRATDGWRSLVLARRDFGTWGNVAQSFELTKIMDFDDPKFLKYAAAVLFKNWLVGSSWPMPYKSGAFHTGLVGLDFAALGSLSKQIPPAWDGLWTGIKPAAFTKLLVQNNDRLFFLARNTATNRNELWEMLEDEPFDNVDGRIVTTVETAACMFPPGLPNGPTPDRQMKKLFGGELYVEDIRGTVDFVVQFRSDTYPCWSDWCAFSLCDNYRLCDGSNCSVPQPFQPGFKSPVRFPQPPDTCQQGSDVPARLGMMFQARITWTGHCKVSKFFMLAETMEQARYVPNLGCG